MSYPYAHDVERREARPTTNSRNRRSSLAGLTLEHLQGPPTSHEELTWALLAQRILDSCDRPWSDNAVRRVIQRDGRALCATRHAVTLRDRCLLLG